MHCRVYVEGKEVEVSHVQRRMRGRTLKAKALLAAGVKHDGRFHSADWEVRDAAGVLITDTDDLGRSALCGSKDFELQVTRRPGAGA